MMGRVDTRIASAGTGKTTTVVGMIAEDIKAVDPERILATTFTVKAADELIERARAELVRQGRGQEAVRLLSAMVGTINSVCGRIVSEFAIDLGRSPMNQVIPAEERDELIRIAADPVFSKHAPDILKLWEALGLGELKDKGEWRKHVACIVEKADENGIVADELKVSARKSIEHLAEFMPTPSASENPSDWDDDLAAAIGDAIRRSNGVALTGSMGVPSLRTLQRLRGKLARGERLTWPDWARAMKLKVGKKPDEVRVFEGVLEAAAVAARHPRLRSDMEAYIEAVFACAADVMRAYEAYKREHGLIDFSDQLCLTLEILRRPEFEERLRERIGLVYVDEFQDSSPIQVAIFLELARIAPQSVWVGDPKQAIYGFRSTDTSLTLNASLGIAQATGGESKPLAESFRSRPGIVNLVNDMFVPAFVRMGLPETESRYAAVRRKADPSVETPIAVWHLEGRYPSIQSRALAVAVSDMLSNRNVWPVGVGGDGTRSLVPGDIAILCRNNGDVYRVASSLAGAGIRVAAEQKGLFESEEVELALAALRWSADPSNHLALAEIARLLGGTEKPNAWLDAVLRKSPDELEALVPFANELKEIRKRQLRLSPGEALDEIIVVADIVGHAKRWGNVNDRIDCLEKMRGLARKYEERCRNTGAPATLAGLSVAIEDGMATRPRSRDRDAVNVLTYHKSKGLEYPIVICADLGSEPDPWPVLMPTTAVDGDVDWRRPLEGRWIRFWPYPFGENTTDVDIDASWRNSETGRRTIRECDEEAVRLLYVGVTRARDHVVLCLAGKGKTDWLDRLSPDPVNPHVRLPKAAGQPLLAGDKAHPVRYASWSEGEPVEVTPQAPFVAVERPAVVYEPLRIRPSSVTAEADEYAFTHQNLHGEIPISGRPEMDDLGSALHSVFAVDSPARELKGRVDTARAILGRWNVAGVRPEDVIAAADRFWKHLRDQYPTGKILREVPVHAYDGLQVISGRIDLLVDSPDGQDWFVVYDHKSFPGAHDRWDTHARKHAPQIGTYAKAVEAAIGGRKRCAGCFVHMPVRGVVIGLQMQGASAQNQVATIA